MWYVLSKMYTCFLLLLLSLTLAFPNSQGCTPMSVNDHCEVAYSLGGSGVSSCAHTLVYCIFFPSIIDYSCNTE